MRAAHRPVFRRARPIEAGPGQGMKSKIFRKTKIVATIGPASDDIDTIKAMLTAGMNVARLNFSHGSHTEHRQRIETIRRAADELGAPIAIMLDTRGMEIRTGRVVEGQAVLTTGGEIRIYGDGRMGDANAISVSLESFPDLVKPGARILIDDGVIELYATAIDDGAVVCTIARGGVLRDRKGVNLPGVDLPEVEMTAQEREDLRFAAENDVGYIAASFVRNARDVLLIENILKEFGASIPIIAKIESRQGVDNLAEILDVADGCMVARGDLGVEIPVQDLPLVQKQIIHTTVSMGKPVITATQMLDSMERNPLPTRAEVSDVANAIFDGTSAVMLSGETAVGAYPVEAVRTMSTLALRAEGALGQYGHLQQTFVDPGYKITDAMSRAAITMAEHLNAAAIVTPTETGFTSRSISKFRPDCPILAITPSQDVVRKLSMNWGVRGILFEGEFHGNWGDETMIRMAMRRGIQLGLMAPGDIILVTHGVDHEAGSTSMLQVLTVDENV